MLIVKSARYRERCGPELRSLDIVKEDVTLKHIEPDMAHNKNRWTAMVKLA